MSLSGKREAFRVDVVARGLDHQRTSYLRAFGNYVANETTAFEAGAPVMLNTDGEIVAHTGADVGMFGVSKYNKTLSLRSLVIDEVFQFAAQGDTYVISNSTARNVRLSSGPGGTGTVYALGAAAGVGLDYGYNPATNTITHFDNGVAQVPGTGSIPLDTDIYLSYSYALTATELLNDGLNFWNMPDDVSIQGGKVTVITGPAEVWTTQYVTSRVWAINDNVSAGNVADGAAGLFDRTASSTSNTVVGKVIQVPTADDPYLGIQLV